MDKRGTIFFCLNSIDMQQQNIAEKFLNQSFKTEICKWHLPKDTFKYVNLKRTEYFDNYILIGNLGHIYSKNDYIWTSFWAGNLKRGQKCGYLGVSEKIFCHEY